MADVTAVEIPEAEKPNSVDLKIAPAKEDQNPTPEPEKPSIEKEQTTDELYDEIQPLEDDERGKFSLKVGEQTYYGQTKQEVLRNIIKGKVEQDEFIRKVKASEKIKAPQAKEEEAPEVALPNEREIFNKHLDTVTKQYPDVTGEMLRFTKADWNKFQDDNGVRDHEVMDLKNDVREIVRKTNELTSQDMRVANIAYVNNYTIREETAAIRDMVAEAKVDIDKFDWEAVFEAAMKKVGKDGELKPGVLTAEATKHILKVISGSTPIKRDLAAEAAKAKAKAEIHSPLNAGKVKEEDNGKVPSYDELARQEKKALSKSGRDI